MFVYASIYEAIHILYNLYVQPGFLSTRPERDSKCTCLLRVCEYICIGNYTSYIIYVNLCVQTGILSTRPERVSKGTQPRDSHAGRRCLRRCSVGVLARTSSVKSASMCCIARERTCTSSSVNDSSSSRELGHARSVLDQSAACRCSRIRQLQHTSAYVSIRQHECLGPIHRLQMLCKVSTQLHASLCILMPRTQPFCDLLSHLVSAECHLQSESILRNVNICMLYAQPLCTRTPTKSWCA